MIGLGSYAYFWRGSQRASRPMTLIEQLTDARQHEVRLFQICDYEPLLTMSEGEIADVRRAADDLGLTLELGTKGIGRAHLDRFLDLAESLEATMLRSMVYGPDHRPTVAEAGELLTGIRPQLEARGITLALETYEQLPTATLVELVRSAGSPNIGICLDPANVVANFESPNDIVDLCAPHVVNWHVKDFAFTRNPGWVGFVYAGAPLGEGHLDYDRTRNVIGPDERGINQIVEFWLPWQDDENATLTAEAEWTASALTYLRSKNND
jgi:sugar phosphate isomerase/epimerase